MAQESPPASAPQLREGSPRSTRGRELPRPQELLRPRISPPGRTQKAAQRQLTLNFTRSTTLHFCTTSTSSTVTGSCEGTLPVASSRRAAASLSL